MIGDQLGGPNRTENMVPQINDLNGGAWRSMETWTKRCAANTGCDGSASLKTTPKYTNAGPPDPTDWKISKDWLINRWIPVSFTAEFTFSDGKSTGNWTFEVANQPRPKTGAYQTFNQFFDKYFADNPDVKKTDCFKGTHTVPY